MGKVYDGIDEALASWIGRQPLWFVATAPLAADGHVNVSPRGHDSFSVLGPRRVAWVDYTGSGVETIAHLRENGRICLMFASFDKRPRIVRLHGTGAVVLPGEPEYEDVVRRHPPHPSTRSVIVVDVDRVSDSCGYGVPVMELVGERDLLRLGAEKRGADGLAAYRAERNSASIDGLPGLQQGVVGCASEAEDALDLRMTGEGDSSMATDPRPHEDDVDPDDAQALSRATGGVPEPSAPDQGSTTGTTESEEFVGRVSGQDVGYAGETGGERRVKWEAEQKD